MKDQGYYDNMRSELVWFLPEGYFKVLEIGCGSGNFKENCHQASEYWGVEPDVVSANKAQEKLQKVLHGLYHEVEQDIPNNYFDLIVCNDVIEHMPDHQEFLRKIKMKMTENGVLIGSVPNIRFLPYLKKLVFGKDWRYEDSGVLDRTHLRFFTERSLKRTLFEEGYEIQRLAGLNPIKLRWSSLKKIIRSAKQFLELLVLGFDCKYMQFGFRATKRRV